MKKLSLILALVLGANASDNLEDALVNGKFSGEIRAWYWDRTDETSPYNNENITNLAAELGYETADFYGFYLGAAIQASIAPLSDDNAKHMYDTEEYTKGVILSKAYLGYKFSKTDIRAGRQFIDTPLVGGNYARILKESFSGVTINSKDIEKTHIFAGWVDKFQGRTSAVADRNDLGSYPDFENKIVLGGASPYSHKFDDVYYFGFANKSIQNLTLTAQYALVNNVEFFFMPNKEGDIHLYYTEANYEIPMSDFKFKIDFNFRGSETKDGLKSRNFNGWMFGTRAGLYGLNGFNLIAAYTTVSDDDAVIMSAGNGGNSYTFIPIRGPHFFTPLAGMDTYKFEIDYNLEKIGIKGLSATAMYVFTDHDAPSQIAGMTPAGMKKEYDGYHLGLNYNVPQVKGLSANIWWTSVDEEKTPKGGTMVESDIDELWVKLNYKF